MSILIGYFDNDRSKRVHIDDYRREEHKDRIFCAFGHPIVGKKGEKQTWHYAHKSGYDNDCARKMGEWHRWWQDRMEDDFLEVIMEKEYPPASGNIKTHIADAITTLNGCDLVVEFQKSVIPPNIIREREEYYDDMIWVFYCGEHRIEIIKQQGRYIRAKLVGGSKFFLEATKRAFLDFEYQGVLEMLRIEYPRRGSPELLLRIWTQTEFDRVFMEGCLKENADTRVQRKPYVFEELNETSDEVQDFLRKE